MKFCKFFPLAILFGILNCSCDAGLIKKVSGSSSIYSYDLKDIENEGIEDIDRYSVRVSSYFVREFYVVPNVYVLDINCPNNFDAKYVASLLLNVVNSVIKESNSERDKQIKFLVYTPGLENQGIIPVLDNFGFSKDDDVYCGSIYRDYSKGESNYLRLSVSKDTLSDLLIRVSKSYNVKLLEV